VGLGSLIHKIRVESIPIPQRPINTNFISRIPPSPKTRNIITSIATIAGAEMDRIHETQREIMETERRLAELSKKISLNPTDKNATEAYKTASQNIEKERALLNQLLEIIDEKLEKEGIGTVTMDSYKYMKFGVDAETAYQTLRRLHGEDMQIIERLEKVFAT
jgi:hypothetical protein